MAGAREGCALAARALRHRPPLWRLCCTSVRGYASGTASEAASTQPADLADLASTTTYTTPGPDADLVKKFEDLRANQKKDRKLPPNRYQYHPPKYYRGPLHPVQVPPSSDPIARNFVPGPFSFPRLKHTYDTTIAPDLMTLTYNHIPPGTPPSQSQKGVLRTWDNSSPYHKNRPRRAPRGTDSSRLGLLERPITWNNIPYLQAVTLQSYAPLAAKDKDYMHVGRAVIQAIMGVFPETTTVKHAVVQWGIKERQKTGAKATIRGTDAYNFVDKLVTLVLPKIKDWPGIKASTGDDSGNLAFGMEPAWMAFFPEIEFNYDMYPPKMVPGCNIIFHTSATSDWQARLLLEAFGFPFYGKVTY